MYMIAFWPDSKHSRYKSPNARKGIKTAIVLSQAAVTQGTNPQMPARVLRPILRQQTELHDTRCTNPQMPARVLRRAFTVHVEMSLLRSYESPNARKGIKTLDMAAIGLLLDLYESPNARKGIKT